AVLDEAAEQARARSEVLVRIKYLEQEQKRGVQQLAQLQQAMAASAPERQLAELDATLEKLTQQEGERRQERAALEHQLEALRKNQGVIQRRYKAIADAGEAGPCPTCGRHLGKEFHTVLAHLDGELQPLAVQQETLAKQVPVLNTLLSELERERARLTTQRRGVSEQVQQRQRQQQQRERWQADLQRWASDLASLRTELGPEIGYDAHQHRDLKAKELRLRQVWERAIALRASTSQLPQIEAELAERAQRRSEAQRRREALAQALGQLGFDAQRYGKLVQDYQAATSELQVAQVALERRRGERRLAEKELAQVEAEERRLSDGLRELAERRQELMTLEVLDKAYTDLRTDLSSRIRPELSRVASRHLALLTEGLYTALELDEEYNVYIIQDGEWFPLSRFSGGEGDVANLSLRLAISEMIADRSGTQLSLLILDEIFGSLDDTRQHNVVQMLRGLSNRFEQIILITHVDTVRHAADAVLRVEYNEQKRESTVRRETFNDGLSLDPSEAMPSPPQ
ncbi:MAG: hypothetical protein HY335_06340, partial [Deinococcus sp.]|nr:hypothetical protein [Deinococcus sp.]